MDRVPDYVRRANDVYKKFCRWRKRNEVELDELPPEVRNALLVLHQNALLVWMADNIKSTPPKIYWYSQLFWGTHPLYVWVAIYDVLG